MIERMAEVVSFMEIVMYMKDSGKTIKLMEKEFIQKVIDLVIRENGSKTFSMDSGYKNGPTDLLMRGKNTLN